MSYTILYDEQVIKTSKGYTLLCLSGSNNCTEFVGNREVREKHWGVWNDKLVNTTADDMRKFFAEACGGKYQEHFMRNGKFVNDKALMRWIDSAIENARTLEEINEIVYKTLCCSVFAWKVVDGNTTYKETAKISCKTSKELDDFFASAPTMIAELAKDGYVNYYYRIGFYGREELRLGKKINDNDKVIAKHIDRYGHSKTYYFVEKNTCGWNITTDKNKAKVFDNIAQAKEYFNGSRWEYEKYVEPKDKQEKSKNYYISINGGMVFCRLTKSGMRYSYGFYKHIAKMFETEKQAQKYIDEKLNTRQWKETVKFSVCKIEQNA